ncbi:MAG: 5'-methylthioadenosine/adenosylhomocysteine nucleosidase [Lachnospiraceae bacterium]|nr:5'-methylthioadenosine/adenosylhomocysteine nucleosidase [Lachnospiraceae bacterium]
MIFGISLLSGCARQTPAAAGEKTGIIGAMDVEVNSLKEAAENVKTTTISGMDFCEGTLSGKNVVIVKCDMGKVNAGICAQTLIREFGCTKIINTGVAGSLDERLEIGDIVVSTDAVQHDFDVTYIGYAKGEIPYTGLYAFPADEEMRKAAVEAVKECAPEVSVYEGRICSGDRFIHTEEQKERITSDFGGMCCEMEGAAIAQVCHLNEVPFVVIRAVSDKVGETTVSDYQAFEAEAAERCAGIVMLLVERF